MAVLAIFEGTTPWGLLALVALVSVGGALLATRLTGSRGYGWAYALLVLAIASAVLGMIATVAYVWAVTLALIGVGVLVSTMRAP